MEYSLLNKTSDIDREDMRVHEYIAQQYVPNPLLIDNKKFDFRLYLLVTGVDTMQAHIAFEGMARFCTEDYKWPKSKNDPENKESYGDNMMGHLTNFCLNKGSENFKNNSDFKTNDTGSKRLLSTMFSKLEEEGHDVDAIKEEIRDISTKVVMAMQPFLVNAFHAEMGVGDDGNQRWFHLFGLDILLDDDWKWWVMEINWFPSFSFFHERDELDENGIEHTVRNVSELDKYLKPTILKDAITIVTTSKIPENSVFEKVFPPQQDPASYKKFTIYNDSRVLFELLAGYKRPDMLTLSQFHKLCHFPGMRSENLTKPQYAIIFTNFAKRGNKSLMTLDNFNAAMEHICKELDISKTGNYHPLIARLLDYIMDGSL